MRKLGTFPSADALSQILLRLTVTSSLYCLSEMTAPWGVRVAARPSPAFHLITAGSAYLEVEGRPDPVSLLAGDLVILPRGEIARRTGYESEVSMSKAFRRHFATPPGAYRRANQATLSPR